MDSNSHPDAAPRREAVALHPLVQPPRITRQTEVIVRLDQNSAPLPTVLASLRATGAQVLAYNLCANRWGSALMFVTDDKAKACAALQASGLNYKTDTVLLVECEQHQALVAQLGSRLLRAGIGVLYSYFSTDNGRLCAVFKTTDDERALNHLKMGVALAR